MPHKVSVLKWREGQADRQTYTDRARGKLKGHRNRETPSEMFLYECGNVIANETFKHISPLKSSKILSEFKLDIVLCRLIHG